MNKKKYISPDMTAVHIETEGMIADSLQIGTESGSEQLSNEKEWSGSDWNEPDGYWE